MTTQVEVLMPDLQATGGNGSPTAPVSLAGVVKAASEIAQRRRDILLRLKHHLKAGENEKVIELARELCGMEEEHEPESHRAPESIH